MSIGVEILIREVRKRPGLYDLKLNASTDCRQKLWNEICQVLFKNWSQFSAKKKRDGVAELMRKWKNLRTCYTREYNLKMRSGITTRQKRKYLYFDQMSFLSDCVKLKKSIKNLRSSGPPRDYPDNNEDESEHDDSEKMEEENKEDLLSADPSPPLPLPPVLTPSPPPPLPPPASKSSPLFPPQPSPLLPESSQLPTHHSPIPMQDSSVALSVLQSMNNILATLPPCPLQKKPKKILIIQQKSLGQETGLEVHKKLPSDVHQQIPLQIQQKLPIKIENISAPQNRQRTQIRIVKRPSVQFNNDSIMKVLPKPPEQILETEHVEHRPSKSTKHDLKQTWIRICKPKIPVQQKQKQPVQIRLKTTIQAEKKQIAQSQIKPLQKQLPLQIVFASPGKVQQKFGGRFNQQLIVKKESGLREVELDDDKYFLLSLLPTFRKFNDEQKFYARTQMLNLLRLVQKSGQHPSGLYTMTM